MGQWPTWWPPCRIQVAPSVQRYKVWLTPCRAVTLPRRETGWNLQGYPKLVNRSQLLAGRSSPYCGDIWRTYCCLTSFFPIVDTCPSCEDIARQSCAMVPRWRFLATLLRPVFSARRLQQVSDLHLKFALHWDSRTRALRTALSTGATLVLLVPEHVVTNNPKPAKTVAQYRQL